MSRSLRLPVVVRANAIDEWLPRKRVSRSGFPRTSLATPGSIRSEKVPSVIEDVVEHPVPDCCSGHLDLVRLEARARRAELKSAACAPSFRVPADWELNTSFALASVLAPKCQAAAKRPDPHSGSEAGGRRSGRTVAPTQRRRARVPMQPTEVDGGRP